MALNTKTIGTGGDYATLAAWQTARAAGSVAGDIEEAVLLDSPNTEGVTIPTANWASGVTLRIRGNVPHNGDPTAGIQKTNGQWFFHSSDSSKVYKLELVDLVFNPASATTHVTRLGTYGGSPSGLQLPVVDVSNCIFTNPSSSAYRAIFPSQDSVNNVNTWYMNFYNCLGLSCTNGEGILHANYSASSHYEITFQGCTFRDFRIRLSSLKSSNLYFTGCLFSFSSLTSVGEFYNTWTAPTASSLYCITSRTQAQHEGIFAQRTGNTYSVSFVDGAPASGQVGFNSLANKDFRLYNSTNNLAIDYVTSGMNLTADILGLSRPQGSYPDAGAFEVFVQSSFQYFLPISVLT